MTKDQSWFSDYYIYLRQSKSCFNTQLFHVYETSANSIVIIIITIIIIISFMQDIYTYIPETNYALREYSVAAILLLLFMVLISLVPVLNLLYFYTSTFRSMCVVPNKAVFCSSFTSCFPGMLLLLLLLLLLLFCPLI